MATLIRLFFVSNDDENQATDAVVPEVSEAYNP
jgi:hypothetical protein